MSATTSTAPAPEDRFDPTFLRLSAGTVYFFFGFLKFYTDLSPAEVLASQTVMKMTFHIVDAETALYLLALMEVGIGLCFLFNFGMRWMFFVFLGHQAATFMPLFIFPELCFKIAPFAPNMEGQYILKNLISVAAGWTVMLPAVKKAWAKKPAETGQTVELRAPRPALPVPAVAAVNGATPTIAATPARSAHLTH